MSLRLRLLLASSGILLLFVLITGVALQKANLERALQAQQEKMQGLVYALLGAIEIDADGFRIEAYQVPEPRLTSPDSGLSAAVFDTSGLIAWQSASSNMAVEATTQLPGRWSFHAADDLNDSFQQAFGFRWLGENHTQLYTIQVTESAQRFFQTQQHFNRQLWLWLLIPAVVLLFMQLVVLMWAIRPLNKLAHEIQDIESGEDDEVNGNYPAELHGLQSALNALLRQEHGRQKKYKQSLDDLAHSLKTPLAVINNMAESPQDTLSKQDLAEQSQRMQQIIQRQLKRASLRSHSLLMPPVKIYPIVQSVLNALKKVYSSKNLDFVTDFDESCQARMNDSDLYELFGNLLDNACKWAQSRVTVNLTCDSRVTKILIQDDGPGFPHDASRLLERGMRADQQHPGQGLGLDMSLSIVTQSGGTLVLENTESGGAGVSIELPS